jgi:hypothetical protein
MNNSSGVNTILIVLLIIIVLGGIGWFAFGGMRPAEDNGGNAGLNVDVNLPGTDGGTGGENADEGTNN